MKGNKDAYNEAYEITENAINEIQNNN